MNSTQMETVLHAALGDPDTGVALLQKSVDARELFMMAMRSSSEISPLLKDPRAQRIVDQVDAMWKTAR